MACNLKCGDGYYVDGEVCDDGNTSNLDGCSSTCTLEDGWYCTHDGPNHSADTCGFTCADGFSVGTEGCDDANFDDFDG